MGEVGLREDDGLAGLLELGAVVGNEGGAGRPGGGGLLPGGLELGLRAGEGGFGHLHGGARVFGVLGGDEASFEELLLSGVMGPRVGQVGLRGVHRGEGVLHGGLGGGDLGLKVSLGLVQVYLRARHRSFLLLKLGLHLRVGGHLRHLRLRQPVLGLGDRALGLAYLGLDLGGIEAHEQLAAGDAISFMHLQVGDAATDVGGQAHVERRSMEPTEA